MGYTTYFSGEFTLDRPLTPEHKAYLEAFSNTRRMKRKPEALKYTAQPIRGATNLPLGADGAYFVDSKADHGQDYNDPSVTDHNAPPKGQPGLWCQWVPSDDGTQIVWDEGEKFYYYTEWLEYLIEHFLKPWGYVLNGEVRWSGEEDDDRGVIYVHNNEVRAVEDTITNKNPFTKA